MSSRRLRPRRAADALLAAGAASLPPASGNAGMATGIDPATPRALLPLARALALVNRVMVGFGMVALLAASLVLTSSVVSRYFFKASTDWQDEAAVFLLVGATFLCGAFVQSIRGHVGIEAVVALLLAPRRTRCAASPSTCSASPSAPSSRGSRGRCCTRPGSTSRRPRRRGRRRCGFPTC